MLRQTPMMANPIEYREAMWAILHGLPVPKTKKDGKTKAPPVQRSAPTADDWEALAKFNAEIEEIKSAYAPPDGA